MIETKYPIVHPKAQLPVRTLVTLPYKETTRTVAFPAFDYGYFSANIQEMKRRHGHPKTGEIIYFREPTISESIAVISYSFRYQPRVPEFITVLAAMRTNKEPFQLGRIVRTSEGIYTNPPKDEKGHIITDEKILKNDLKRVEPLRVGQGNIYLGDNDFGFAEYSTFNQGRQSLEDFLESGLARILEHAEKKTEKLAVIASPLLFKRGVSVTRFDPISQPAVKVVYLSGGEGLVSKTLDIDGGWDDFRGHTFAVLDSLRKQ